MSLPSLIPAKQRVRRKRRPVSPPSPAPVGVRVVSVVSLHDGSGYRWTFDTNIESVTPTMANGYDVDDNDPGDAADPGINYRDIYYGFDDVGLPWEIVGSPTDITFAGGLSILPGQSGITSG